MSGQTPPATNDQTEAVKGLIDAEVAKNGAVYTREQFSNTDLAMVALCKFYTTKDGMCQDDDVSHFFTDYLIGLIKANKINANQLPKISDGITIWYSSAAGGLGKVQNFQALESVNAPGSTNVTDGLNLDVIVKAKMWAIKNAGPKLSGPDAGEEVLDLATNVKFVRDPTNRSEFIKVVDGQTVSLGKLSAETDKMFKKSNKCYGMGLDTNNTDFEINCTNAVFQCLLSDNKGTDGLNNCVGAINKNTILDLEAFKKDLGDTHPVVVYQVLKRFGFKKRKAFDPATGMRVEQVQSVPSWLAWVKSADDTTYNKINDDAKLKEYLRYLVAYVNSNPSILNKNYPIDDAALKGHGSSPLTDFAEKVGLKHHFKVRKDTAARYSLALFRNYLQSNYLGSLVKSGRSACTGPTQTGVASPFGAQVNLGSVYAPPLMGHNMLVGGGKQTGGMINYQMSPAVPAHFGEEVPVLGAALVESLYKQALKELEARGSSVDDTFKTDMGKKLSDMKKTEEELLKNVAYIDQYNRLYSTFGSNWGSSTLSLDTLKQLVARGNKLQGRTFSDSLVCLELLQKLETMTSGDL